jgi:hypothetical protein
VVGLAAPCHLFIPPLENTLKAIKYTLPLLLVVSFFLTSCGYRNPYVYSGPDKNIYITNWKNRTNLLRLNSDITQSLNRWYQKSGSLRVVKDKENADLILGGEILSVDLPSLSYGANSRTKEVKVKLTVRYILMDLKSGKVLFEVPRELRTEEYTVTGDVSTTADNEKEAIDTIVDEMSQKIYLRTITEVPKL